MDHRGDGAEPIGGVEGDHSLGGGGERDGDPVSRAQAERRKGVGDLVDLPAEFPVAGRGPEKVVGHGIRQAPDRGHDRRRTASTLDRRGGGVPRRMQSASVGGLPWGARGTMAPTPGNVWHHTGRHKRELHRHLTMADAARPGSRRAPPGQIGTRRRSRIVGLDRVLCRCTRYGDPPCEQGIVPVERMVEAQRLWVQGEGRTHVAESCRPDVP